MEGMARRSRTKRGCARIRNAASISESTTARSASDARSAKATSRSMRHRGRGVRAVSGRDGVWLPTGEEAAAFDTASHAIVPERVMMENAGRAAAAIIQKLHPRGRILGYAGSGHNGGDLLVALRTLHCQGR